jgi:hypothetical protein
MEGWLKETQQRMQTQQIEADHKIKEIAERVDAVKLFVAVATMMTFGPAESMTEAKFGPVSTKLELLAYYLYPFFGKSKNTITPSETHECWEALDKLFTAYTWISTPSALDKDDRIAKVASDVEVAARIIRGSAYPEQTMREIDEVEGKFDNWYKTNLGIGPKRAIEIISAIHKIREDKLNRYFSDMRENALKYADMWQSAKRKKDKKTKDEVAILRAFKNRGIALNYGYTEKINDIALGCTVTANDLSGLNPPIDKQEWVCLLNLIGMNEEIRKVMRDPVEVRDRPLFTLPGERVFFIDISNTLDVLWSAFEKIANDKSNLFQQKYQRHKGQWLNQKVIECLLRIFPANNIYRNLTYVNPDKKDGSSAEIDCIVDWGPFIVLIEAKAKQFRMESQLGDVGRLRTDIKKNIEDAFEQARRAERHIRQVEIAEFVESHTGRKLHIQNKKLQRVYLVTISQHYLAGLATDLAALRTLGLFRDGDYPVAFCLADLDIISQFCEVPCVFLHYIERRLTALAKHNFIGTDEIDFFGAYLDTRLQMERFNVPDIEKLNWINLGPWSDEFDKWMQYKRGHIKTVPSIKLKVPEEVSEVLLELHKHSNDDAKWIAFALLDMSDSAIFRISKAFKEIRGAKLTHGKFRRLTFEDNGVVISFMGSLDLPKSLLQKRTVERVVLEKYRRKANKSIGFGIMVLDAKPFECAVWTEEPWKYDKKMEDALEMDAKFLPAPGQKLPGRNQPCICGSGRKFKRCCMHKLEIDGSNKIGGDA